MQVFVVTSRSTAIELGFPGAYTQRLFVVVRPITNNTMSFSNN